MEGRMGSDEEVGHHALATSALETVLPPGTSGRKCGEPVERAEINPQDVEYALSLRRVGEPAANLGPDNVAGDDAPFLPAPLEAGR